LLTDSVNYDLLLSLKLFLDLIDLLEYSFLYSQRLLLHIDDASLCSLMLLHVISVQLRVFLELPLQLLLQLIESQLRIIYVPLPLILDLFADPVSVPLLGQVPYQLCIVRLYLSQLALHARNQCDHFVGLLFFLVFLGLYLWQELVDVGH